MIVPAGRLPHRLDVRDRDRLGPGDPLGHAERPLEDRSRIGEPQHEAGEGPASEPRRSLEAAGFAEGLGGLQQQADAVRHHLARRARGPARSESGSWRQVGEGVASRAPGPGLSGVAVGEREQHQHQGDAVADAVVEPAEEGGAVALVVADQVEAARAGARVRAAS